MREINIYFGKARMDLNIIVCVKSVVVDAPEGRVVRSTESCELNPFDRPALEVALHLREVSGGTVTDYFHGSGGI